MVTRLLGVPEYTLVCYGIDIKGVQERHCQQVAKRERLFVDTSIHHCAS
jgi:hypothetical protein